MREYLVWLKATLLLILLTSFTSASNAPFSYSYTPKFVYKNQVFPVTILVKHYEKNNPPHFEFDMLGEVQPIDNRATKLINRDEAFFTFYFKADGFSNSILIPQLSIWTKTYTYTLHPKKIDIKRLDTSKAKNFSNLLASNLKINGIKIDPYDSENSLVTLRLVATEANLEDIKLPNVTDDGIENIKRDGARVRANYYFITPSSQSNISFSYYNLIKNRFITKDISTSIKDGYSQDIKLSPQDLTFDKLKKYITFGAIAILLVLLILTRDALYLILSIALIAVAIYLYINKKSICIQEGASVYILPTQNSNISREFNSQVNTTLIRKYKNFNKVEYKNIRGWVKDEDLCKD